MKKLNSIGDLRWNTNRRGPEGYTRIYMVLSIQWYKNKGP